MKLTSLATAVLSAATCSALAVAAPLPKLIHMHPHTAQPDGRVSVTLHNPANLFRDVEIAGKTYTIMPDQGITVLAPVGTPIYAASLMTGYRPGDLMLQVGPQDANRKIEVQ